MTVGDEVVQIFREEAQDRLGRIVDGLLSIEAARAAPEMIDSLFLDAHSIKGNAGMVGFDEVRVIAHAMEDLLGDARAEGELEPVHVEPLLKAADAIRRVIDGESGLAGGVVEVLSLHSASAEDDDVTKAVPGPPGEAEAPEQPTPEHRKSRGSPT